MRGHCGSARQKSFARLLRVVAAFGLAVTILPPGADAASLKVHALKGGLSVKVVRAGTNSIVFTLDGRRIAHVRTPPYRMVVRNASLARPGRPGVRTQLIARDAHSGRLLAKLMLVRLRRTGTVAKPTDVDPPAPPAAYDVPESAVRVSTSAGLAAALAASGPLDIALADGVYDNPGPFLNPNGHRLWAANVGRATLTAGISVGGNWGPGHG